MNPLDYRPTPALPMKEGVISNKLLELGFPEVTFHVDMTVWLECYAFGF